MSPFGMPKNSNLQEEGIVSIAGLGLDRGYHLPVPNVQRCRHNRPARGTVAPCILRPTTLLLMLLLHLVQVRPRLRISVLVGLLLLQGLQSVRGLEMRRWNLVLLWVLLLLLLLLMHSRSTHVSLGRVLRGNVLLRFLIAESRVNHCLVRTASRENHSVRREELVWLVILPEILRNIGRVACVKEKIWWRSGI